MQRTDRWAELLYQYCTSVCWRAIKMVSFFWLTVYNVSWQKICRDGQILRVSWTEKRTNNYSNRSPTRSSKKAKVTLLWIHMETTTTFEEGSYTMNNSRVEKKRATQNVMEAWNGLTLQEAVWAMSVILPRKMPHGSIPQWGMWRGLLWQTHVHYCSAEKVSNRWWYAFNQQLCDRLRNLIKSKQKLCTGH